MVTTPTEKQTCRQSDQHNAIAGGRLAQPRLVNNGIVVAWGNDASGQTNVVGGLNGVKLIAGGGDFSLAVQFSTTVSYPVECVARFVVDLQRKFNQQHCLKKLLSCSPCQ